MQLSKTTSQSATPLAAAAGSDHGRRFTRKNVALAATTDSQKMLVIIHDNVYDVTHFLDHHPGGSLVLRHMVGKDCTDAFINYHRSSVSKLVLNKYCIGCLADPLPVSPHVQDFRAIRNDLLKCGMYDVDAIFYRNLQIWLVSLFAAAMICSLAFESVTFRLIGAGLLGLFWQQAGGYGHDLGHSSVSNCIDSDRAFASTVACCFTGLSIDWWKLNHNTHHVVPNSVEHDPDIQHLPLMAVSTKMLDKPFWSTYYRKEFRMDGLTRFFVSYQHLFFFPIMMVLARFNLYLQSWSYLLRRRCKQTGRGGYELCSMVVFAVWFTRVACAMDTWWGTVMYVLVAHFVSGILHIQIVLSHWAMDVYREEDKSSAQDVDWYMMQLRTTLNIDCPSWLDWFHVGLQFQIVHHMFPLLPRSSLRRAMYEVERICCKHGLTYYKPGFLEALWQTLKVIAVCAASARAGTVSPRNYLADCWKVQG